MNKLKYLAAFSVPLFTAFALFSEGWWTLVSVLVYFVLIPLLELVLPTSSDNLSEEQRLKYLNDPWFDMLLYVMVPIQIGLLIVFFSQIQNEIDTLTLIGRIVAMGIMNGVIAINVGHELGHRSKRFEVILGEILLSSSLESHFLPYHNRGHHADVATPNDPATARRNEPIYFFWIRSHFGSYFKAWEIEIQRMQIMKKSAFGLHNKMVIYTLTHLLLLSAIYLVFGPMVLLAFLAASTLGILLLETVNYIEHYGLLRKKRENGMYEHVRRQHSWNSNQPFGRTLLFELTRHSDHHYKADRPYQILESHDESPLMPTGYPGMMMLSLLPPLFFKVVNSRIDTFQSSK